VFLLRAIRILARENAGFPHSPSFPDSRLAIFQFVRKKKKRKVTVIEDRISVTGENPTESVSV